MRMTHASPDRSKSIKPSICFQSRNPRLDATAEMFDQVRGKKDSGCLSRSTDNCRSHQSIPEIINYNFGRHRDSPRAPTRRKWLRLACGIGNMLSWRWTHVDFFFILRKLRFRNQKRLELEGGRNLNLGLYASVFPLKRSEPQCRRSSVKQYGGMFRRWGQKTRTSHGTSLGMYYWSLLFADHFPCGHVGMNLRLVLQMHQSSRREIMYSTWMNYFLAISSFHFVYQPT